MQTQTPPTRSALQLLLATERPAVETFFAGLGVHSAGGVVVERVRVSVEDLRSRRDAVDGASVAVVDVSLDAAAGLAACQELSAHRPNLSVVALVCCPHCVTAWNLRTLLAAGVSSVLDLQASSQETFRALESAADGRSVLHLHLRRGHRGVLRDVLTGNGPTEMQMRLLTLVTLGLPDHELARRVHLSPHTVKHHIEQLRREVGARNRTELAAWGGRHGFYAPELDRDEDVVPVHLARPRGA
jgi:DNA-binding NarL/FixJ family response regulator